MTNCRSLIPASGLSFIVWNRLDVNSSNIDLARSQYPLAKSPQIYVRMTWNLLVFRATKGIPSRRVLSHLNGIISLCIQFQQ